MEYLIPSDRHPIRLDTYVSSDPFASYYFGLTAEDKADRFKSIEAREKAKYELEEFTQKYLPYITFDPKNGIYKCSLPGSNMTHAQITDCLFYSLDIINVLNIRAARIILPAAGGGSSQSKKETPAAAENRILRDSVKTRKEMTSQLNALLLAPDRHQVLRAIEVAQAYQSALRIPSKKIKILLQTLKDIEVEIRTGHVQNHAATPSSDPLSIDGDETSPSYEDSTLLHGQRTESTWLNVALGEGTFYPREESSCLLGLCDVGDSKIKKLQETMAQLRSEMSVHMKSLQKDLHQYVQQCQESYRSRHTQVVIEAIVQLRAPETMTSKAQFLITQLQDAVNRDITEGPLKTQLYHECPALKDMESKIHAFLKEAEQMSWECCGTGFAQDHDNAVLDQLQIMLIERESLLLNLNITQPENRAFRSPYGYLCTVNLLSQPIQVSSLKGTLDTADIINGLRANHVHHYNSWKYVLYELSAITAMLWTRLTYSLDGAEFKTEATSASNASSMDSPLTAPPVSPPNKTLLLSTVGIDKAQQQARKMNRVLGTNGPAQLKNHGDLRALRADDHKNVSAYALADSLKQRRSRTRVCEHWNSENDRNFLRR